MKTTKPTQTNETNNESDKNKKSVATKEDKIKFLFRNNKR